MKCIKDKLTRKVSRVSDDEAARLVAADVATYCPKREWKAQAKKVD